MAYVEFPKPKIPAGYESLPVGADCVKLTVPTGSRHAIAKVADYGLRWRDDGPSAENSATGGIPARVHEIIELTSPEQIDAFRAIGTGGTGETGVLNVNYYKN